MTLTEIVRELKENGRPAWPFVRQSDLRGGYWTVNSDEFFQFDEGNEETKELAFTVDDIMADDWFFLSKMSEQECADEFDRVTTQVINAFRNPEDA